MRWKAVIVGEGSVMEALLLDSLLLKGVTTTTGSKPKAVDDCVLGDLIDEAELDGIALRISDCSLASGGNFPQFLTGTHFVAVRVDQDARPDLANRYEDYGWPATIIFAADGTELIKRRGYIAPERMAALLQAVVDDSTPGPSIEVEPTRSFPATAALGDELRARMRSDVVAAYDPDQLGWGRVHKYLDADAVEYALTLGDAEHQGMAIATLGAALALIDPVWGGACQYSTGGRWDEPHFEKIVPVQADFIRTYARAWQRFNDQRWLDAAQAVRRYVRGFLAAPDGGFFTSQDADLVPGEESAAYYARDDAGRRALGVPRVDRHRYARDNGLLIAALCDLYACAADDAALAEALTAARWIIGHRSLGVGGFRHDEQDAAGPYLADTLAMGRAFLALYGVTGDREWLERASAARGFIDATFRDSVGYDTAARIEPMPARPQRDENVTLARWANLLWRYTSAVGDRAAAELAFRYLAEPGIAEGRPTSGTLLADDELGREPPHATIVGAREDPAAARLFSEAIAFPAAYKRVDWWDRREGPLPGEAIAYPESADAAAFVCSDGTCSRPLREGIRARLDRSLPRADRR